MFNKVESFKKRYLSLIDCKEQTDIYPSMDGLNKIMENHLYHIHFNGFAFLSMDKNAIELDPYKSLDKLSEQQGGICFELNASLNELLKNLGYKTYLVDALIDNIKDGSVPSYDIATHNAIVVEFESKNYLVDVGLGNYFRKPISFSGEYQDFTGRYQVRTIDESSKAFQLERFSNKQQQWLSQYRFSIINKNATDFTPNIEKVCDESCHLTKEFFMIKPYAHDSYKVIDGGRGVNLVWIHKAPDRDEKINLDASLARQILTEEFHMKAEQIDKVLSECKTSSTSSPFKALWTFVRKYLPGA